MRAKLLSSLLVVLVASACNRQPQAPVAAPGGAGAGAPAAPVVVAPPAVPPPLADVIQTTPRYTIGISYPKSAARYPGLAALLQQYAQGASDEITSSVAATAAADQRTPYELSLSFNTLVDTPLVIAIAADGYSFTGGAHGNALVERFVWLPQQSRRLTTADMLTGAGGWRALSGYVREQLSAALSQRLDADEMAPAERASMLESGIRMIDDGSGPDAQWFDQFEPMLGADGKLSGIRLVFAPMQVGAYVDGTQSVEVPASVLRPYLDPAYRDLFGTP